jgi:predicted amidophosphoribosyltransferase
MTEKSKTGKEVRTCPFCDEDIAEAAFPYCEACSLTVLYCPKCGLAVPRNREKCPHCGADMKRVKIKGA